MAQKRMFDKSIIETDNFLSVSLTAKAIYFLLGMEADDEGFVSPNRIARLYGGEAGDIKNLIDVGLIIPFKSGVVVITDWNQNNWLDNRRIKPTQYQNEKKMLSLTNNNKYVLSNGLAVAKPEERRGEENSTEETGALASQDAQLLGDGSSVEPDEDSVPTKVLARSEGVKKRGYDPAMVKPILEWGEDQIGSRFIYPLGQKKAIVSMLQRGKTFMEIKKRWDELKVDFLGKNGVDFLIVAKYFHRVTMTDVVKGPQSFRIGQDGKVT